MSAQLKMIASILACPDCRGRVQEKDNAFQCPDCQRIFAFDKGILEILPKKAMPLPEAYKDPDYLKVKAYETMKYMYQNPLLRMAQYSGHRWIAKAVPASGICVDLGCGNGAHFLFSRDKAGLVGLDSNRPRLEEIARANPDNILLLADMHALPFQSGSIRQLLSIYALEHMFYLDRVITEILRVLHKEGRIFVSIPTEGGLFFGMGRSLTSARYFGKLLNVDYNKYIKLEHCNPAKKIMRAIKERFIIEKIAYWPFLLPSVDFNITISMQLKPK